MSGRAGYTLVVYVLDVSPSMGEMKADPAGTGGKRQRLDWAKELIARQCEPKVRGVWARLTNRSRAVARLRLLVWCPLVVVGGSRRLLLTPGTNNQANRSWLAEHPDDDDPPYAAVSSDVAIQTAKPKTLEVLMNLDVGEHQGNRTRIVQGVADDSVVWTDGRSGHDRAAQAHKSMVA